MSELQSYVNQTVTVLTTDGRIIVGTFAGFDQTTNVIMKSCHERVFSSDSGVEKIPLGLYLLRGDSIIFIGELDEAQDEEIDYDNIRAEPIGPLKH
ncbi:hypothetical protein K493DRAFT_90535 [Basidiobolus meristosporus CBS 931.73]|uniref:LSM2-LSM8 complex subunit LSM8 n=1 Tax=Basidiobolus meristosporus CBS 931.73 TaxID=1314790 RepID=A0A1Y1XBZ9_9FUNG|nr:hypothetical protein K493DRAFT_90535 [Basidiobolus meristosporus CBS 931.73]|eukprot:ORX82904.1 hypothetical protein K493DRAFT_90535 [Basidiobolus meristosporus CBS 931.73]